jgi:uroporphyrinogen decarboxylase
MTIGKFSSKERVLTTIRHQPPDRVPIDCWMSDAARENIRNYYRFPPEEDSYESWHTLVMERFHVDFRWPKLPYIGPLLKKYPDGSWESEWGVIRKGYGGGVPITHPLRDARKISEIENYPYPVSDWYDFSGLANYCQKNSQYAIIGGSYFPFFTQSCTLMGMDRVMTNLYDAPVLVEALMNKLVDVHISLTEKWLSAAPGMIDIIICTDDYGSTENLLISPNHWRKYIRPMLQRVVDYTHSRGLRFMLHSDGAIREIIPDLIDIGVDILNPIETDSKGMDYVAIKRDFGKHLAFHGAMSSIKIVQESAESIVQEVYQLIKCLAKGGGYIFTTCNVLTEDTPVENIEAVYRAAYMYGRYG